jgi:hypothetical protein
MKMMSPVATGPRKVKIDDSWSDLNRAVEMRFRACLANGGHTPSGDYVSRPHGQAWLAPLSICARCEVPYREG